MGTRAELLPAPACQHGQLKKEQAARQLLHGFQESPAARPCPCRCGVWGVSGLCRDRNAPGALVPTGPGLLALLWAEQRPGTLCRVHITRKVLWRPSS